MGLRAASVRHPNAGVMAPALTESNQTQNFKITSTQHLEPVTSCGIYIDKDHNPINGNEYIKPTNCKQTRTEASDNGLSSKDNNIMSNSPPSMGDLVQDNMGLEKNSASFFKDKNISPNANDMDQTFGNDYNILTSSPTSMGDILTSVIPSNNLGSASDNVDDILQVFKSMGSAQSDNESVFPLSSTDLTQNTIFERELLHDVDVIGMCEDEPLSSTPISKEAQAKETLVELHRRQTKLERRTEFLLRRLRKIQARSMGQHVSEEVAGLFEHVTRTINRLREQPLVPKQELDVGLGLGSDVMVKAEPQESLPLAPASSCAVKSLVKSLERSSITQSNNLARQRHALKYFGSGSVDHGFPVRAVAGSLPAFVSQDKCELERVSGLLYSELSVVEGQVDSDATASSSGGESCDETQAYNNPTQQYLSM